MALKIAKKNPATAFSDAGFELATLITVPSVFLRNPRWWERNPARQTLNTFQNTKPKAKMGLPSPNLNIRLEFEQMALSSAIETPS
jgi:hypothetical protein